VHQEILYNRHNCSFLPLPADITLQWLIQHSKSRRSWDQSYP